MSKHHKVLIVDPNRDAADTLADLLQVLGWRAAVAYDEEQGFSLSKALRPSCIVCETGVGCMWGDKRAKYVRAAPWGRGCLLVAFTGWPAVNLRHQLQQLGFDRVIFKPDTPALLCLLSVADEADASVVVSQ